MTEEEEQVKAFLIELTRLSRKYGIVLDARVTYDEAEIELDVMGLGRERGCYAITGCGLNFIYDPAAEFWGSPNYIIGQPPEDQASDP